MQIHTLRTPLKHSNNPSPKVTFGGYLPNLGPGGNHYLPPHPPQDLVDWISVGLSFLGATLLGGASYWVSQNPPIPEPKQQPAAIANIETPGKPSESSKFAKQHNDESNAVAVVLAGAGVLTAFGAACWGGDLMNRRAQYKKDLPLFKDFMRRRAEEDAKPKISRSRPVAKMARHPWE